MATQALALSGSGQSLWRLGGRLGAAIMRLLPPELAHEASMWALAKGALDHVPFSLAPQVTGLALNVPGLGHLQHPIGLAAGFDKHARCPGAFARMGFAFLELGTITPRPQAGNPRPRLFRYPSQRALINRMGFNSDGAAAVAKRLAALAWNHDAVPLGINLGKNKATPADTAVADYLMGLQTFGSHGRYLVINVSSPNTPGLRQLAQSDLLTLIAREVPQHLPHLFVKLDPDMPKPEFQQVVGQVAELGYQGLVLCNTHRVTWPQPGGLSGASLASLSQARLEWAHEVHQGSLVMIASGGIFTGLDVYERLIRGASAVQIYSALVYRGPHAVLEMLEELYAEMHLRGVSHLADIIGSYYHDAGSRT